MDNVLILSVILAIVILVWLSQRRLVLPPGPKGLPLVGNVQELVRPALYEDAVEWGKQYDSDIVSLSALGKTVVILNSVKAINELLQNRGSNFSDRPSMPMLIDLVGWDWTFALMRYGPRWKRHRQVFHLQFNLTIREHRLIQEPAAQELLQLLLKSPELFLDHIEHYTARIILQRVYGYKLKDAMTDPFVLVNKAASATTAIASLPGSFAVDAFPILKYVPEWVPGAGFKKIAKEWRKLQETVVNRPFDMVVEQRAKGAATHSFVNMCLEEKAMNDPGALDEVTIKSIAAVVYAAGSDTNLASLTVFMLAMTLHPEAQKRAQKEIDEVIGDERLPTFADRDQLPYLWNVFREVMRWIVVFPFAIPHRAVADDTYKGFHIPKDATVMGNSWAILHDPEVYKNPEDFIPERFEDPKVPDPIETGVFGYGRRSCAGKSMAIDTVWLAMATVLATYDITQPVDESGNFIKPKIEFIRSAIKHPAPFKCVIKPRSAKAVALIKADTI